MDAPGADVTHCLQTNRSHSSAVGEGSAPATEEEPPCRSSDAGEARATHPEAAMPCRRSGGERFLLLERAVSLQSGGGGGGGGGGGAKEVDALVARLGEVLQLGARPRSVKYRSRDRVAPYSSPQQGYGWLASLHRQPPRPSLVLLQPPAAPPPSGSPRGAKQLCGRGWLRGSAGGKKKKQQQHPLLLEEEEEEDDPHRLLQQLILSGNLIKEAVRRLQLAATAAPTAETSTTDSPGSTSSVGSCHSEGDAAAPAAPAGGADATFTVSPLQPLP